MGECERVCVKERETECRYCESVSVGDTVRVCVCACVRENECECVASV